MSRPGYPVVLDLTLKMHRAANAQEWDELVRIESERRSVLTAMASEAAVPRTDPALAQQARATIAEIERVDREIIEQVEAWKSDVAVLLGMGKE